MTVIALDWNATRVCAVLGPEGDHPLPVPLDPPGADLPLAIRLDQRTPTVGASALRQCRSAAHLVCQSFLPFLTEQPGHGPRWQGGRHSLDARSACEIVWRKLHSFGASARAIVLTVPSYFQPAQADALRRLGELARLPIRGSVPATLAAAVAGHVDHFWTRAVLVVDVDDYALTIGWVRALADKAHLIESRSFPHLGMRFWNERLIDALSDQFVLQHRRDPRDAPQAEQSLYDQLEGLADAARENRTIQFGVQGREWFKHLLVHPDQSGQFCSALVHKTVAEVEYFLRAWPTDETPPGILLTHQAGRLPGLVAALQALGVSSPSAETFLPQVKATDFDDLDDVDFGTDLMGHAPEPSGSLLVLSPEAPARAAHGLAEGFRTGALPVGHLETIAPLAADSRQRAAGSLKNHQKARH